MTLINRVKEIGRNGYCPALDLFLFLPNLPTIHGSEPLFTIDWRNKFKENDVEYLVKGLHLIEENYKIYAKNSFGLGSPSPTYNVIIKLKATNPVLAERLIMWVFENGGNYYINQKRIGKLPF